MPEYRRADVPGAMYFFTVVTYHRAEFLTTDIARKCLRESFREVRKKLPFSVEAIVLLPNHLHTLWRLPPDDADFSSRWQRIKTGFTTRYLKHAAESSRPSVSRSTKRERGVWQRRYWEHLIRDDGDLQRHFDYIHYNPVKHGYVKCPIDWRWSTFRRYTKMGWYNETWGDSRPPDLAEACAGEPDGELA